MQEPMATVENDEDKVKAQRVLSAISSSGKNNRDKFSVYDGGRATQWARKQLRNLRDNQATAHRLKLESMFSFLPKKLIEVVHGELKDKDGSEKSQIIPTPSKTDFYGVIVMADLVKSTMLSEEMEDKAMMENCGGLDSIDESVNDGPRDRKGSMYIPGEKTKSSHTRTLIAVNAIKKQAHKLRDAQNDASKLGAERLRTVLTKYFRKLVGVTMNHGGDVVRIAGDAIISVFEDNSKSIKKSLEKAQSACLDILTSYNNYNIDGNNLQVRLYMVIGSLSIFCVGGYQGRWEYMISGKPFADLKAMGDLNEPGELCMGGECWDILYSNTSKRLNKDAFEFVDLRKNGAKIGIKQTVTPMCPQGGGKTCVLLKVAKTEIASDDNVEMSDAELLGGGGGGGGGGGEVPSDSKTLLTKRSFQKSKRQYLVSLAKKNKVFEARLKHFVPVPVMYHCDHQNIDLDWMEEAAQCSAMFVTFKETIHDLAGVQKVFLALQRIIVENSGIIKEFSMDDKGLVLVVGFGLQPNVLPNPSASACLAALQIRHSQTIGNSGSIYIGIATGQVFCAAIGSDFRREFALVGKVVNLAARLAFFARKLKSNKQVKNDETLDICVDATTMNLAKTRIDFISNKMAKNVSLKGIKGTTSVYCPIEPRYIQLLEMANLVNTTTVGRREEQDLIHQKLESFYDDLEGGILLIKGQSGTGKTHLVQHIIKSNKRMQNLLVFKGKGGKEPVNLNIRMSLSPQSFQCAQVEGLDAWTTIIIKLFTMFRDGCLEPENGVAWKDEDYKMIKYAYTKYIPGNLSSLDNPNGDTVKGRTFFIKTIGSRFLKDHVDSLFLLNFLLAANLPPTKELNQISEAQSLERAIDIVEAAIKVLIKFSPVAIVIDEAHYCDIQSIGMIREIAMRMHEEVLIVLCCKNGHRYLPDMRLHVPQMQADAKVTMRNTILASSAFASAGKSKVNKLKNSLQGLGEGQVLNQGLDDGEEKKDDKEVKFAVEPPKMKPIPPKLAKKGKFDKIPPTKSPRKSVMEKRIQKKKEAMMSTKNQVMAGKLHLVAKVEDDIDATLFDDMIKYIREHSECEVSEVSLPTLNFNETIAMTGKILGTQKICNITAAAIYGHTQGNPQYVKLFAAYLKDPGSDETFGGPVQNFDQNLQLSNERTWTLTQPRVPENFLSYTPPEILDEVRVALKNCSAQQMWILKVMSVVGGSDCPIHLIEELLEDAVLSVSRLEDDLCELIAMGIIEHTVVRAIKPLEVEMNAVDRVMMAQGGGNASAQDDVDISYLTYTFINVHCQSACYQMLSFSRRQELHVAVANWYEDKLGIYRDESSDEGDFSDEDDATKSNATKKTGGPIELDPNYKKISKKYACFMIHHYFMASRVEISIAICELIGAMDLQHWCGQYARKVLTKMPADMPDAVFHRIYPCIQWLQGVSSIINALKKGKVGFGTIAAGKMVSKKLDIFRKKKAGKQGSAQKSEAFRKQSTTQAQRKKTIIDTSKRLSMALGMLSLKKDSPSKGGKESGGKKSPEADMEKVNNSSSNIRFAEGVKEVDNTSKEEGGKLVEKPPVLRMGSSAAQLRNTMVEATKKKSKMQNYGAAYGGKAASKAVEVVKKKDDEEVLKTAATFKGISWNGMMNRTKAKLRTTIKFKLFTGEDSPMASSDRKLHKAPGRGDGAECSTVRRQFSSGKALRLGAGGIPSGESLNKMSDLPTFNNSTSPRKNRKATAFFGFGGRKQGPATTPEEKEAAKNAAFWTPEFDVKLALAQAASGDGDNSETQNSEDNIETNEFDTFSRQLMGYIDLLKQQHSVRKLENRNSKK